MYVTSGGGGHVHKHGVCMTLCANDILGEFYTCEMVGGGAGVG